MRRRNLLSAADASLAALAAPRIGRAERSSKAGVCSDFGPHGAGPGRNLQPADAQLSLSRLRHALRHRYELGGAATNGQGPRRRRGWSDLEPEAARRSALSRQRAGAGTRRRCQHPPVCRADPVRPRADGGDRGTVGARRPHRTVPPEAAVSASTGSPCRAGRHRTRHHARASGGNLAPQTGRRDHRQRPLSLPLRRACQRRPRSLRSGNALLHAPMVLLYQVVQVFRRAQLCVRGERAIGLPAPPSVVFSVETAEA
jgi:hypothetical protein